MPNFTWFDVIAKTGDLGTYLADASALGKASGKKYIVQIVVYDLPDRDCAALASNGEFTIANNGLPSHRQRPLYGWRCVFVCFAQAGS